MSILLKLCASARSRAAVPWAFTPTRQLWQGLDQRKATGQLEETRVAWQQRDSQKPAADGADTGASSQAAEAPASSPLLADMARVLEGPLSLKLGKNCMVGEGLATVELGLFVEGRMVAVQVEPPPAPAGGGDSSSSAVPTARAYAEARTRQRVLQSFGWATATVLEQEWAAAGQDDHKKMHLLVSAVKKALGQDGEGGHQHHSGCGSGCSH